ncbi:hypothetical protein Scep_006971 [Stephania cephalantha]|uniref:Uncharacterized protein n=1 Tax=Stephania cephalantha TaxID=152367 RepID=A0AAP0KAL7_9MAGN
MDAADGSDLVEGASVDPAEKAEGKEAAARRRANEGRQSISKSALEARAVRRESKPAEEGRRSVQRRERRMGAERGGEEVGVEREEDGENLQVGAGGEEGVETGE